ncbi:hypothetical protein ULMS_05870 [Patiriisocius marinistellae]|uniref:Cell envelope biogenesis protein OmpA n=1 Tax=Patiriisocius marinistellae TaxID=2494560 RepID=A0A5J4FY62_9FLAO|nr:cell envelope biogenesis protein OmpA [Patiriisocius marinistellae]GEQ85079.1 hypothetical protein ULMS_05870 [Patiriisocius marinistellae]
MVEQEEKLQLLRDILLIDDRQVANAINERIDAITQTIDTKEKLSEKVDPILDERFKTFIEEIPTTLGPTITKTLKEEIANSKDAVVEALYPIMGQMIKKYIGAEIEKLSEAINQKMAKTFSMEGLKRKVIARFTGQKEGDLLLSELDKPIVNEIFAIQKGSGILLGNYSVSNKVDKDMVSGMLTAIKSFVEDAFGGGNQNLESIDYELYSIHIYNFHSYYIAVVMSGHMTSSFENKLENRVLKVSRKISSKIDSLSRNEVDKILTTLFKTWKAIKY